MPKNILFSLLALAVLSLPSCKNKQKSINLEQINNPSAQHIITPGMNSIGLIHNQKIFVYYLNESRVWVLDQNSQFDIPKKSEGLLATGMGSVAVLHRNNLYFYNMNASLQWESTHELVMPIPEGYKRISAMRMPWQRAAIGIEDEDGQIRFYYLDDKKTWQMDETATFTIPAGIDDYIMMGSMEIAIISENKLGIYQLSYDGTWAFQDDMVLSLPDNTDAVLSYESGSIAVLTGDLIQFYEPDYTNRYWLLDDTMNFHIPQLQ
jgi:hypothetical protein